jgi:DNA-binding transcriptional regulator YiaG
MTVIVDVKAVRERHGWSQDMLAKRMGVSSYEVLFFERRGCLSDQMAERLARAVQAHRGRAPMAGSRLKPNIEMADKAEVG